MLAHLRSRGLLNDLELSKVTFAPGHEHSGLIVAAGPSRSIAALDAIYRHPDAEAFVAQRCDNDWSLVSPTATVSDTPDAANGINLPMAEVRFEELLKAVRRAQSVDPIG